MTEHPTKESGKLSMAEYDEVEATAIADDILNRSYQYGDNLEPLARSYLALVAERDVLREVAKVAQWTVENNAYLDQLKAALDSYHRTLLERLE